MSENHFSLSKPFESINHLHRHLDFSVQPGVVSPHELLQKLQLVQQEQSQASHNPPRLCPGLAPRFLGPAQGQASVSAPNLSTATAGEKAALQFQVSTVHSVNRHL